MQKIIDDRRIFLVPAARSKGLFYIRLVVVAVNAQSSDIQYAVKIVQELTDIILVDYKS